MKLAPWNPVRVAANLACFRCDHCGAVAGTNSETTVMGFMRKLRAFERRHNRCAPAARVESAARVTSDVIRKIQRKVAP